MDRLVKCSIFTTALVASSLSLRAVSMDGDTINASMTPTVIWAAVPASAVVGPGAEFTLVNSVAGPVFSVDASGNSVVIQNNQRLFVLIGGETLTSSDIDFPDSPGSFISGFNLTANGTGGIDESDVAFTGHSFTINMDSSAAWDSLSSVQIELLTSGRTGVPDFGSTISLLGVGVAVVAALRQKVSV